MEHERTCFFIGHREANERVLPALEQAVEQLIAESGVTDFVVGHYGAFDGMAAKVIKAAKKRHPEVTLTLLLPYHPFDRPIPVPKGYDSTFYPRAWKMCRKSMPSSAQTATWWTTAAI